MKPAVLVCACALVLPGCYAMTLDEFDSVARWEDPLVEPRFVDWLTTPRYYPWYEVMLSYAAFGVFGLSSVETESDNPARFARERLAGLIDMMGSDPSRLAQVSRRLLWVADLDPNPFNRIAAVRGMERVMQQLGADVLDPTAYYVEAERGVGAQFDAQKRAAHATVVRLLDRAERPALTEDQRAEYLEAMQLYTARPLERAIWRRNLIRTMWSVFVSESDRVVHEAARQAMHRSIHYAVCNGLRSALVPLDVVDFPAVRSEALFVYRRLGGIPALPFVLNMMARPNLGVGQQRYDRDANVRMALVRLCGQLQYEHAVRGVPRPIEFLYETAVDEDENGDVRRVALEGLARCLHKQRRGQKFSFELDWAKAWWKQYVATRGNRP